MATIIGHQGFADFFSQNAIYQKYLKEYKNNVLVFVSDDQRQKLVKAMLPEAKAVEIPKVHHTYDGKATCIECHTYGSATVCPRHQNRLCSYVDYAHYPDMVHIKLAAFYDYGQWQKHYDESGASFAHCFYTFHGFPLAHRIDHFSIERNPVAEAQALDKSGLSGQKYAVIHEPPGCFIDKRMIPKELLLYNLHNRSETFLDQIAILESAQEIHLVDSSYAVLLYFLSQKYHQPNTKVVLHLYCRSDRDTRIYHDPTPKTWTFVTC